jgi:penicillin-binding protein 1A
MALLDPEHPEIRIGGRRLAGRFAFAFLALVAAAAGALAGLLLVYSTDLPQVSELENYRPSTVTELYDDKGRVIGSFALQRRVIVRYEDFPKVLRDAVTSVEDKDFDRHWGVDLQRIFGAAWRDIVTQSRAQGASTLTMQLSRNLFLSPDRSFSRKLQEVMLAIQIERRFTKPQIFAMYGNQIYLGHGVYGFEAGAQYYFGKPARALTLPEAALLAALPKSPVIYSPVNNPENAVRRRNLVINAMLEDGKITLSDANAAKREPLRLSLLNPANTVAPYFVEEVRQYLEKRFGSDEVHQGGLRVYTTLDLDMQRAANRAALDGVAAYERRHGWKGRLRNVLAMGETLERYQHPDWQVTLEPGDYLHVLVTAADERNATVRFGRNTATLGAAEIAWTGRRAPNAILRPGDIAYVKLTAVPAGGSGGYRVQLEQDSGAQVALLAVDNATGDIKAMVGGRTFGESKFNRATQALRQVGSSFKPYVYTAALEAGTVTPDSVIVDAPITFPSASGPYTPSNYDGRFWGAIPLRVAVANSRNIPALKVAAETGIPKVIEMARRFGITSPLPPVLPLALGAAEVTLSEQVAAFTTFPNDGVRVTPRYIRRVTDYAGHVREETYPDVKDVISAQTARIMTSLLQGVVQMGTATPAKRLNHPLAGKTGTTNDFTDAWFVGFSPSITCGVWIGFDEKKTLGSKETGGQAALPIWIDFMKVALQGRDGEQFTPPDAGPPDHGPRADHLAVAPDGTARPAEPRPAVKTSGKPASAPGGPPG